MGLWTCGFSLFLQVSVSVLGWSSWICENAIDKRESEREREESHGGDTTSRARKKTDACLLLYSVRN